MTKMTHYFLSTGRLYDGRLTPDELLGDPIEGIEQAMAAAAVAAAKYGKHIHLIEAVWEEVSYCGPRWVCYDVPRRPPAASVGPDYSSPDDVRLALDSLRSIHLLDDDDVEWLTWWAAGGPYPDCPHGDGRYDAALKLKEANSHLHRVLYDRWVARQPRFAADPKWAQPTAR